DDFFFNSPCVSYFENAIYSVGVCVTMSAVDFYLLKYSILTNKWEIIEQIKSSGSSNPNVIIYNGKIIKFNFGSSFLFQANLWTEKCVRIDLLQKSKFIDVLIK